MCIRDSLRGSCTLHHRRCLHTHGHRAWHLHRVFPAALWSAIQLTVTSPWYGIWESACPLATDATNECHESATDATNECHESATHATNECHESATNECHESATN
eukprot:318535-Amphidinium_carterae.1